MTDWQTLPFALDVSHHNGTIDWPRVAAQRPACVLIKATERMWTDPMFDRNRRGCIDNGIPWIPYVFLRPDDSDKTREYFIDLVGDHSVPAALDWEEPQGPGTNPVASGTVEAWIDALEADGGRTPLAYYGQFPPAAATAKIATCPRWYPQYPGSATASPRVPMWDGKEPIDWRRSWLIWQWSDKGGIAGISGNIDMNRVACSAEVFAGWYKTGRFASGLTGQTIEAKPDNPVQNASVPAANPIDLVRQAQRIVGVDDDGDPGPATRAALRKWLQAHPGA